VTTLPPESLLGPSRASTASAPQSVPAANSEPESDASCVQDAPAAPAKPLFTPAVPVAAHAAASGGPVDPAPSGLGRHATTVRRGWIATLWQRRKLAATGLMLLLLLVGLLGSSQHASSSKSAAEPHGGHKPVRVRGPGADHRRREEHHGHRRHKARVIVRTVAAPAVVSAPGAPASPPATSVYRAPVAPAQTGSSDYGPGLRP
jgi:hypothetical protein